MMEKITRWNALQIVFFTKYYSGDQIKEDGGGGVWHVARMG